MAYLHFLLTILLFSLQQVPTFAVPKHYIVYLGSHHAEPRLLDSPETITSSHHDLISSVLTSDVHPSERMIYSYNKIFNGFAATLFQDEADELAKHPSVVSIFESRQVQLHTTRSMEFLGMPIQHKEGSNLDKSLWANANYGEDLIIAAIDTGIVPESKSFSDEGYGRIPIRFKGICANQEDPTFKCNRKLIGARYFYKGLAEEGAANNVSFNQQLSPRDKHVGHGTMCLSVAGGNFVSNASWNGYANGIAKGMAPRARLVSYKVFWEPLSAEIDLQGVDMDTLAAFEAAIDDGVDVINLSLAKKVVDFTELFADPIPIGSFYAMKNGILTIASIGNNGPDPMTVENVSPWMITVGASTIDREFTSDVVLGNGHRIKGERFYDKMQAAYFNTTPEDPIGKVFPVITGADARLPGANIEDAASCKFKTLDRTKVAGKYVVCLFSDWKHQGKNTSVVRINGGVGVIFANTQSVGCGCIPGNLLYLTAVLLCYNEAQTLLAYINSTRNPTVLVTKYTTSYGIKPTPVMAPFSGRGPNPIDIDILKPDVIAPGVDILAATLPSEYGSPYNIASGTSQASPHVAGLTALLKKLHPDWHPSAIKSAIMTTASPFDNNGKPILDHDKVHPATPFAIGSGHIRPELAMDPGLVYDMDIYDYFNFLCSLPHKYIDIERFSNEHSYNCPHSFNVLDFNYPSISITNFTGTAIATRKLKNVGQPGTYVPRIEAPQEVTIVVDPNTLVFSKKDQVIKFKLIFTANVKDLPNDYLFGSYEWSDGKHVVRSPIVLRAKKD